MFKSGTRINLKLLFGLLFLLIVPAISYAIPSDINTIEGATANIKTLIKTLTGVAYALVFLAFFWGFAKYLTTYSDEKKKDAMKLMITSIAVIFVMTSIWGIVSILQNTLGITGITVKSIRAPKVQIKN